LRLALRKYGGSEVNNSTRAAPHIQKTSLHRTQAVPNRPQVCEDSLRRIPPIPFLRQANGREPRSRLPCYCRQKISRAAGSTPARAAQGMATTSCCEKSNSRGTENFQAAQRIRTAVRRWRLITGYACVGLAWWCRLWRLWSASGHALQLAVCLFSLRSYYLSWLFFSFWIVSGAPNSCPPPTTFSSGIRSSKRISLSLERFCR